MKGLSEKIVKKVTDRIIAKLENGDLPPWSPGHSCSRGMQLPYNFKSNRPYRGTNVFFLILSGFDCPAWNTFDAWKKSGHHIKKGEHGTPVIAWIPKPYSYDVSNDSDDNDEDTTTKSGTRWIPIIHNVFNAEQTSMKDEEINKLLPKPTTVYGSNPIENAEGIFGAYQGRSNVTLKHRQGYGCYTPSTDTIKLASLDYYETSDAYYSTLFHEAVHSTGHPSRLGRLALNTNHEEYSKEELVAEMGAALLCSYAGVANEKEIDNSAAYLKHWLKTIKADPSMLISAGSTAQKAIDLIIKGKKVRVEKTA